MGTTGFRNPQALSSALAAFGVTTAQGLRVSKYHSSLGVAN